MWAPTLLGCAFALAALVAKTVASTVFEAITGRRSANMWDGGAPFFRFGVDTPYDGTEPAFYDLHNGSLPWVKVLEAAAPEIRRELREHLKRAPGDFKPYFAKRLVRHGATHIRLPLDARLLTDSRRNGACVCRSMAPLLGVRWALSFGIFVTTAH